VVQANDSILVTPGTGATVATHLANSKEHQVVMHANAEGHIMGSIPTYSAWSTALASAASKVYLHIFNAAGSTSIVKVRKLFIQPSQAVNALTAQTWRVSKTSAVGTTGNTAITIRAHDSTAPAVPAAVTAAHSFTAGGTDSFTYWELPLSTEETLPGVHLQPFFNILPVDGDFVGDYVLRAGEGLKLTNLTGGAYTYSVLAVLTIE
jgi:hypothetical protein